MIVVANLQDATVVKIYRGDEEDHVSGCDPTRATAEKLPITVTILDHAGLGPRLFEVVTPRGVATAKFAVITEEKPRILNITPTWMTPGGGARRRHASRATILRTPAKSSSSGDALTILGWSPASRQADREFVDVDVTVSANAAFGRRSFAVQRRLESPPTRLVFYCLLPGIVQIGVMLLVLATAIIHITLAFPTWLFILNGPGYLALLAALSGQPCGRHAHGRALAVAGVCGRDDSGIGSMGERSVLAYATKAIEALLVVLLFVESHQASAPASWLNRRVRPSIWRRRALRSSIAWASVHCLSPVERRAAGGWDASGRCAVTLDRARESYIMSISWDAIHFTIALFCVSTLFAMGLGITLDDVKAPFRNLLALAIIVAVNNFLVPLLGLLVIAASTLLQGGMFAGLPKTIVPLEGGQQLGFILIVLASGSLMGPALARLSGVAAPFARGIMVVLVGISAVLIPVELDLLARFTNSLVDSTLVIDSGAIFTALLVYQLLPLALGILVKLQYDVIAVRLRPLIVQLTGLSFLVLLGMLAVSGLVIGTPAAVPGVRTEKGATTVTPSGEVGLTGQAIRNAADGKIDTKNQYITRTAIAKNTWVVLDASAIYTIESTDPPTMTVVLTDSMPVVVNVTPSWTKARTAELNKGVISKPLLVGISTSANITPTFDLAVVLQKDSTWILATAVKAYFVDVGQRDADGNYPLVIYQMLPESPNLVSQFVKTLEALPVVGPFIEYVSGLVVVLLPYAMFAALAALLLVIGNYTGVAVRNLVGVSGNVIPRTLATTTAVRGVTMALIVAVHEFGDHGDQSDQALTAIAVVLVFYLVSLIVAGHQAVQWGKEAAPPSAQD